MKDEKIKCLKTRYQSMKARTKGQDLLSAHIYEGLEILERDEFVNWAINDERFNELYEYWYNNGKERRHAPSIDRIDPEKGYITGNMQWLKQYENCGKARRSSGKEKKKVDDKHKLTEIISIRLSPWEKAQIEGLAKLYAGGNMSLFITHAALIMERKFLDEDDLIKSKRRIKDSAKTRKRKGRQKADPIIKKTTKE